VSETTWGPFRFSDTEVAPGESADLRLKVSESYTADPVSIAVTVIRGREPGPTAFVTASVHGDELNGVGIVRDLLAEEALSTLRGTLIAVPVANVPGFLTLARHAPDRRDLNRSFPGNERGSLTSRLAAILFREVVERSDFGIDLHTGGGERSNFPQVRADLSSPPVARLARDFGLPLVIHGQGPRRSLRRTAVRHGVPTLVYEAGSPRRFERRFIDGGLQGVLSVLHRQGMLDGEPVIPPVSIEVQETHWLRARAGGILDLRVRLGQPVHRGQLISVNTNPFGRERSQLQSNAAGIVIGLTRLPVVHPGDAVCHLARVGRPSLDAWTGLWQDDPHRLWVRRS
jgi:predicted deacylase